MTKFWAAVTIAWQAVGVVAVFIELEVSRTSIKTTPRRLAVPVAATVKLAVERAILQRVPEIREVVAENVTPLRDEGLTCTAVEDEGGRVTISLGV